MRVCAAQIAPVLLDREATLARVEQSIREAAAGGARLVAFGEALVPGYPVWIERTDGARFESDEQKAFHARYADAAVQIERGDLDTVCAAARECAITVVLGTIERPPERGGKSLYCTCVYIDATGEIRSTHRKLVPTYEERLSWSPGDGHGLTTHSLAPFTVGALNCWENWMPLARATLHAFGEDLHVAIWPGGEHNTRDITRFAAREGRSFVLAASSLMRPQDIPDDVPLRDRILERAGEFLCNGGSCAAGPDGAWIVEPVVGEERLVFADFDFNHVLRERQNFDPSGHYSRPDVFQLTVDRQRQWILRTRN